MLQVYLVVVAELEGLEASSDVVGVDLVLKPSDVPKVKVLIDDVHAIFQKASLVQVFGVIFCEIFEKFNHHFCNHLNIKLFEILNQIEYSIVNGCSYICLGRLCLRRLGRVLTYVSSLREPFLLQCQLSDVLGVEGHPGRRQRLTLIL